MKLLDKYIDICNKLYKLTNPLCGKCKVPNSCCDISGCEMAIQFCVEVLGEDITIYKTNNKKAPFLTHSGCVLKPYQRPACTKHLCDINSCGFILNNNRIKIRNDTTAYYFKLINSMNELIDEMILKKENIL